jgi:hypothetical protein
MRWRPQFNTQSAGVAAGARVLFDVLEKAVLTKFYCTTVLRGGIFSPGQRLSGMTGISTRPNVEFSTPANEAYHAASAVAMPM